jgi:hypothetical protein
MADNRGKLTEEGVNSHEQRLATLAAEVERLKVGSAESRQAIAPTSKTECAMRPGQAMDGIISYLAKKHGGNVHTQKIVTVTAKSVRGPRYALFNAVDLASHKEFASNDEPGQWICWDFKDMRVRLTHYTISTEWITLWVLEGSLDGANWIGLHRPPGPVNLATASFAVSEPSQFRFIRLTQTDKNVQGTNILRLTAVEFFGTLFE